MIVPTKSIERRSLLPVESVLVLMINFGSLIAALIFGILAIINDKDKK